MYITYI